MEFHDLFAIFVSSLIAQLSAVPDDKTAFEAALEYVGRWKRMLEVADGKGLSREAQRGLLGELHFLEHQLLPTWPAVEAVSSWRGPSGSPQDFIVADVAAEVKTTITKRHSMIRIQSEKQLDETVFRALFLVHVRIDEAATGISLDEQVERTKSAMSIQPLALTELNLKLAEYGYKAGEKIDYAEIRYAIAEPGIYRVGEDFPRITENVLPDGVGDLSYTIVADTLGRFLISAEEFTEMIGATNA